MRLFSLKWRQGTAGNWWWTTGKLYSIIPPTLRGISEAERSHQRNLEMQVVAPIQ